MITAAQVGQQMASAAQDTSSTRMQALAGASTALSAYNTYEAVASAPAQAGGVNVSVSFGSSKSQSTTSQSSDTAAGSTVAAGGDVRITAKGAGADSDLTIRGSDVTAGHDLSLRAEDAINLEAPRNTSDLHSQNSSSSGSMGVSMGTGGMGVVASGSRGKGKADGSDTAYTNTHVEAGNSVTMESGGDTRLAGAVVSGERVMADVGGDLTIESLQDTGTYKSNQKNSSQTLSGE